MSSSRLPSSCLYQLSLEVEHRIGFHLSYLHTSSVIHYVTASLLLFEAPQSDKECYRNRGSFNNEDRYNCQVQSIASTFTISTTVFHAICHPQLSNHGHLVCIWNHPTTFEALISTTTPPWLLIYLAVFLPLSVFMILFLEISLRFHCGNSLSEIHSYKLSKLSNRYRGTISSSSLLH